MDHSHRVSLPIRSIAPFFAMAALSLGCATLPKTGAQDNGQALLVDVHTENYQYVAKVKAGEVVHKDSSGNVIGTSEAYEDKLMSASVTTWATFQGEDKLDDEDFFRIAGDTQAADDIQNGRARAVALNRAGWVVTGVGVGVGILGAVLAATVKTTDNTDPMNPVVTASPVGRYVLTAGIITALIGVTLAVYGNAAVKREHPLNDVRRAKRDERKYNKEHSLTPVRNEERRSRRGDDEE